MRHEDLPNVLIIGAPKCGTTSMFRWLADHPAVCGSSPKETWFFAGEELDYLNVRPNHRLDGLDSYLACFRDVDDSIEVKLEASTHYLYSETALNFFASADPQPKLIVLLRDPAIRIWSHFNYIRQRAQSPIAIDFPDFVDSLTGDDQSGDLRLTEARWPRYLLSQQLTYSNYYEHLMKWQTRFAPNHLYVAAIENIAGSKKETVQDIAAWIGIDVTFYDDYSLTTANAGRTRGAETARRRLARFSAYFPAPVVAAVRKRLDVFLSSPQPSRSDDEQAAIEKLGACFKVANDRLEQEFGLDLSGWPSSR